jgi:hypothetical protein
MLVTGSSAEHSRAMTEHGELLEEKLERLNPQDIPTSLSGHTLPGAILVDTVAE